MSQGADEGGPSDLSRPVVWLKRKASGGGFELEPSNTVLSISKRAYQARTNACWPTWTSVPDIVKETIWQDILGSVDMQEADLEVVKRHWNSKVAKNYKETMNNLKTSGKRLIWIGETVWNELLTYWNNNPDFLASSERNATNRSKNPVTHRGGSKSFQHHREDLERACMGHVSYWDVFEHTHALSQTDDTGSVSYTWDHDNKARERHEKFQAHRAHLLESTGRSELTKADEDMIFDAVMDKPTRNRRYGYGNLEIGSSQHTYQRAQDKEEIAQLKAQIAELNKRDIRRERQYELLNQKLEDFMNRYGTPPSSSGGES